MVTFRLNDVSVRTSDLTQRSFRATYCDSLVEVTPSNQREALDAFAKGSFSGLHVSGVADLSFLADFPNLRYLEVVKQEKVNTRYLDPLSNLRGLRLETPGAGIDFSCFPELEVFVGDWHAGNSNLDRCQVLRQLRVWQFKPRSRDLADFAAITRLERLKLVQTGIESLDGVETMDDLRYLEIAYAPKLRSVARLAAGRKELRELEIEKAKTIESYAPIAELDFLRSLKLSWCAPMADLKWTRGLSRLDFFSFVETNVEDGDLAPLLELPRLRCVGTMDKKHYSMKCDALNAILAQRAETAP